MPKTQRNKRDVLQNEFWYDFRKGPREISAGTIFTVYTRIIAVNTVIKEISRGHFRKSYRKSFCKTSLKKGKQIVQRKINHVEGIRKCFCLWKHKLNMNLHKKTACPSRSLCTERKMSLNLSAMPQSQPVLGDQYACFALWLCMWLFLHSLSAWR